MIINARTFALMSIAGLLTILSFANLVIIESAAKKALVEHAYTEERRDFMKSMPVTIEHNDTVYNMHQEGETVPIVIKSHKLVFFTVAKAGCTVWKQLFRRMMGADKWKGSPHNTKTNGLKYLNDYPIERATQIMNSPNWTKAIFIRDPKERLVSAYLDKVARRDGQFEWLCCPNHDQTCTLPPINSLSDFVNFIQTSCTDQHWMPQSHRMEHKFWRKIDFVGHVETAAEDAKRLLLRIGAWEAFGTHGWGGETGKIFEGRATIPHATSSSTQDSWSRLSRHYTPELESEVERYYREDYAFLKFNMTLRKIEFR